MLYAKPDEAATATLKSALEHLEKPLSQTFLAGVFGGLAMALSGTVALLLATGIGEQVKEQVPILPRFLQGTFFPLGLVVCLSALLIPGLDFRQLLQKVEVAVRGR